VSGQTQDSTTSDQPEAASEQGDAAPGRLDYAIAGGGVSGLYTAWRLLADAKKKGEPKPSITIYEAGDHTGGRLLTWLPMGDVGLRAELGGMRFLQDQLLVWNLLHKGLDKPFPEEDFTKFFVNGPNLRLLLRGVSLVMPDADDPPPPDPPDPTQRYLLPDHLKGQSAGKIVGDIINEVLGTSANEEVLKKYLHGSQPKSREDWDAVKPYLTWRGKPLSDVGFWNLISDIRTPETYQYVIDAFGYFSLASNWNAAEAMAFMDLDFQDPNPYMTLTKGYQALPDRLRDEVVAAGVKIELNTRLASFTVTPDGAVNLVLVRGKAARYGASADKLVLAMPRRALELVSSYGSSFDLGDPDLKRLVSSVSPVPAFKLFLFYEERWWEKYGITVGRSVSDLPIRQTYYMPPDPRTSDIPIPPFGLIMASYDDARAVDFWQGMVPPEDEWTQGRAELHEALAGLAHDALAGAENTVVPQPPPHLHKAPDDMIRHAREQLALLHDISVDDVPEAVVGAFADWGLDPFGGGWNFWAPQVDVKDAMTRIKTPLGPDRPVYVVGDGYSGAPGWVEGALTVTEAVLERHLGVDYPNEWLPEGYYLGW
jgi:monoamine oxidase